MTTTLVRGPQADRSIFAGTMVDMTWVEVERAADRGGHGDRRAEGGAGAAGGTWGEAPDLMVMLAWMDPRPLVLRQAHRVDGNAMTSGMRRSRRSEIRRLRL